MNRIDAVVQQKNGRLTVAHTSVGWIARIEWITKGRFWRPGSEIHGLEAKGSSREAAVMSLDAALGRQGVT